MIPASWRLVTHEAFADDEWPEVEARGLLMGSRLAYGDRSFPVIIYGPVRIAQDAEGETANGSLFYEANVILVNELTKETAEDSVLRLGGAGVFDWLLDAVRRDTMTQPGWRLAAPDDFDEVERAEIAERGVLVGARLMHGDREFPVVVYDPVRIGQDAERGTEGDVVLYEANVIVVENLSWESAEDAVARLARSGAFDWLLG